MISGTLDDALRRELIYEGTLLVFKDVEPMFRLCELTDGLIRDALDTSDPVWAQFELAPEDYAERIAALQKRYSKDKAAQSLFREALEYVGVEIGRTCWDLLRLRAFPHSEELAENGLGRLGVHRDTWGSNVYAHTNWWAPIYPITAGRTIAFYPAYWSRPIGNTSESWSLEKVRAARRAGDSSVPLVPELVEPVDAASELRVVIEPGDLLCFSGAHLHVGVPNSTGVARFSVEIRTVDTEDLAAGTGAPNVDGAAPEEHPEWFSSIEDEEPLPAAGEKIFRGRRVE
ncbi:hypothetical protein BH24ACT22_BH24ACT22_17900 [soil metagenome]